ncbi:ankyrin repeat domain-containing protein SOWAHA-like [Solea senegalensis]|uniref:Ankyrin repeat domain-containing protein SOWAHA-like n=1 Tax=Solea senegalensis TaxID=28829 RepID=A0AAV6SGM3_SOLSE|nr:ankyrin repeat domain-containing protein SOWAHA-like [Solea senegalensis]KAG7516926.1 ankyrin repeat domain-containing protein SOWAHA-like [Solea senegalensis]
MALTQQSVLSLLLSEGGRVKKSDLVSRFKGAVDCVDPAQKERNRELLKTFVNSVAFVKEIDGVRYVVIKKVYRHLLKNVQTEAGTSESEEGSRSGEQQRPPAPGVDPGADSGLEDTSAASEPDPDQANDGSYGNPLSPIQQALRRSQQSDFKVKRMLNFEIQTPEDLSTRVKVTASKPYALPLRTPPSTTRVEVCKLKLDPDDVPQSPTQDPSRNKKRPPSVEERTSISSSSPQLRRAFKSTKASEETDRDATIVPLEQSEHEWLVKCAAGHWSQVYGLLLRDSQLAEKRDFMSGFTALHWAAKCGNSDMLVKIVALSRKGGVDIDINAKTHGGYTPLHIAALHDQEFIMNLLVMEYGADVRLRDNCGKKAFHYLHKGISRAVRVMLGEPPAAQQAQDRVPQQDKEELDLFPDLSKGLHSISRLFQPHTSAHKKKHKHRLGLFSLNDEDREDREDREDSSSFRPRLLSEVFM